MELDYKVYKDNQLKREDEELKEYAEIFKKHYLDKIIEDINLGKKEACVYVKDTWKDRLYKIPAVLKLNWWYRNTSIRIEHVYDTTYLNFEVNKYFIKKLNKFIKEGE